MNEALFIEHAVFQTKCDLVLQLAGTAVFAIGLWLRLDPKTKGLFEGQDSPYVFYTGKILSKLKRVCCSTIMLECFFNTLYVCRCLHPDRSWSTDDGSGFSWMLWGHSGVSLYAGTGQSHNLLPFVMY